MHHKTHEPIPRDHPVQPLAPNQQATDRATCGHCGLSWDDGQATSMTPAPSARCPFEAYHIYPEEESDMKPQDNSPYLYIENPDRKVTIDFADLCTVELQIEPGQKFDKAIYVKIVACDDQSLILMDQTLDIPPADLDEEEEQEPDPGDMDGDHETGLASAGFGTDEDYGYYGGDE